MKGNKSWILISPMDYVKATEDINDMKRFGDESGRDEVESNRTQKPTKHPKKKDNLPLPKGKISIAAGPKQYDVCRQQYQVFEYYNRDGHEAVGKDI